MSDTTIDIDLKKALGDLSKLKIELDIIRSNMNNISKAAKDPFDAIGKGSIDAAKNLTKLRDKYQEIAKASAVLKEAMRNATDTNAIKQYAQEIARAEAAMNRLGAQANSLGQSVQQTNSKIKDGGGITAGLVDALAIGGAVAGVSALASKALELAKNYQQAKASFTAFLGDAAKAEALLGKISDFAGKTGLGLKETQDASKALLGFGFSAESIIPTLQKIGDVSAATGKDFNELTAIYGKARTAGVLYAEDINQLTEAGIPIIELFAKQLGVSTEKVKKLASDGRIGFAELELAFGTLTEKGGKFYGQLNAQAETLAGKQANLSANWDKLLTSLGTFFIPILTKVVGYVNDIVTGFSRLGDSTLSWSDRLLGAVNALIPISNIVDSWFERQAASSKKSTSDIGKNYKDLNTYVDKLLLEQNAIVERNRLAGESAGKQEAKQKKEQERLRKERERQLKEQQDFEDKQSKLRIDAMDAGLPKLLEQENERWRLFKRELVKYHVDTTEAEEQHQRNLQGIAIKYAYDTLGELQKLETLKIKEVKQLNDDANGPLLAGLDGFLIKVNKRAEQLSRQKKPFTIWSLFGLDPDKDKEKVDFLKKQFGELTDALQKMTDARVEAADKAVDSATRTVDAANEALQTEIALGEADFASNVDLKKRELEEAKKAQQLALDEKKKALRVQLALDSASQASDLIVTSTKMFKSLSELGPIGVVLAIAQIASVFAFMAGIRAKAKAISAQSFGEGGEGRIGSDGVIVGPSHAGGGVPLEVEGGEFFATDGRRFGVVNRKMTDKHFDAIMAINRDDKQGIASALSDLIGKPRMNRGAFDSITIVEPSAKSGERSGDSISRSEYRELMGLLKEWKGDSGRTILKSGNTTIERSGNHTRIVRNG